MVGWLLGAAINLVGSVMINLGTNVMKLGHNKRAMLDLPEEEKPAVSRFKEWQIGTVVFIVGNVANFVSFGFAAQSLLAALGSVQFVSNVFFASFVLKEKVTMLVIIATTCIIGGCMLLVLFGNHSSEDYTVDALLALYRAPPYIVYLVMMFVFVMGSYILYLHGKHVANQKGREQSLWVTILPVTYSIFSALLGTQSVLFSKSLSVLLRTTFSGHNMLGNWYTWVTLICFLITAGFWVTRLNKGLRLFPAMIIVPLMQICWTLFSIVSGMIYFKEYTSFNPSTAKHGPLNAIMFCLGVSIVFCGVFLLTKSGASKQEEYEDLDEQVQADQLEMVNNPAFEASPGGGKAAAAGEAPDPDVPQRDKLNMDTLRFTSLASSTAANIKAIGRAQRARLGQTMSPGRGNFNSTQGSGRVPGSPGMDGAASEAGMPSLSGTAHMMGTLKKGAKKISHNLRKDFNVDLDELKQIIGMGQGGYMPALSLFAMPAVDLTASRRARQAKPDGLAGRHSAMLSALPSSRFFGAQEGESGLEETRSEDLERASRPLMNGLPSSSAQGPEHSLLYLSLAQRSGRSFPGMPGLLPAASMPATPLGRSSSGAGAGGSGSFSNDPSLLQGLMSKMSRIKDRMQEDKARAYQSLEDGAGPPQPDDARPSAGGEADADGAAADDSRDDDGAAQPELPRVSATPDTGSRQQRQPVQVPQSASAPHQLQSRSSGGPTRQEIELREAAAPSPRVQQGPQGLQQATPAATAPVDPGELL